MIASANRIVQYLDGANLQTVPAAQLVQQVAAATLNNIRRKPDVNAKYDAASDSVEFANYWANSDSFDADSANSKGVRTRLVKRSRYEIANNGYADGIAKTHATFLVGDVGPTLRVKTGDSKLDKRIELEFGRWSKAVKLRAKMWTMAHAKLQDGEAFAVMSWNPAIRHAVKLDVHPIECDQVTSPQLPYLSPQRIDGIYFDEYGNVVAYDILKYHPGSQWSRLSMTPDYVPAKYVCHWFQQLRPGQHRGIPECKSTLQVGASSRRMREATVSAVETAASLSGVMKTDAPAGQSDPVSPMSEFPLERRTFMALPMGWDIAQMAAQHPNATYDEFLRSQIKEQARPKSMPYNMAACDSSQSSYASGRLDFQPYFAGVDLERADCEDSCCDPIFTQWWREASVAFYDEDWGDSQDPPEHYWDWPNHPVADLSAEGSARDAALKNGTKTLRQAYAEQGDSFEDRLAEMAQDYGVSDEEMRKILRTAIFNSQNQQASITQANAQMASAMAKTNEPPQQASPRSGAQPSTSVDANAWTAEALLEAAHRQLDEILAYNPNHDEMGRFAPRSGAASLAPNVKKVSWSRSGSDWHGQATEKHKRQHTNPLVVTKGELLKLENAASKQNVTVTRYAQDRGHDAIVVYNRKRGVAPDYTLKIPKLTIKERIKETGKAQSKRISQQIKKEAARAIRQYQVPKEYQPTASEDSSTFTKLAVSVGGRAAFEVAKWGLLALLGN